MSTNKKKSQEKVPCLHENLKQEAGYIVCRDCGLILDENVDFDSTYPPRYFPESQIDYERNIRVKDSKALQDPKIMQKYKKLQTLNKWFRDYQTDFSEQKKIIELLKSYGIGLNIDKVKFQAIKERYLRYNKYHRQTYQNMIIIFLAIVWMEIKDTTNVRVEEFIRVVRELGHKINKKMLYNAMAKVKRTETMLKNIKKKTPKELEKEIKEKIKILFQKDLNNIPYERVKDHFTSKEYFERQKIEMLLKLDKILKLISYDHLKNLNYKAFTAGLIYYIGQTLKNRKIFTQNLVEEISKFSSTTIRKKYHILTSILGDPQALKL